MASEASLIFDTFNLDLLVKVLQMTVLSPLFAFWVPIIVLTRNSTSSPAFFYSSMYTLLIFALSFLTFSSKIWSNKYWQKPGPLITSLFSGPSINWEDQIVVITGGAGGVGKMLVEVLAVVARGATVVVLDREELEGEWDDVYPFKCELGNEDEIAIVAKKIREEIGNPTILINNAGIVHGKLLLDLTASDIKQTFDVNVISQFLLIKEFLPDMLKNGTGHIVTVSSLFGMVGCAQLSDYSASKHALLGLHDSLHWELKYRYNDPAIRLSLLLPGRISTPLFSSLAAPSPMINFLAPTVEPHEVVKRIVSALETEESRTIYMPTFVGWWWIMQGVPSWLRDGAIWISGANDAMTNFGRGKESEVEKKGQ